MESKTATGHAYAYDISNIQGTPGQFLFGGQWLPTTIESVLNQSIWDSYVNHKLMSAVLVLKNFRVFKTDFVSVDNTTATINGTTNELPAYKFRIWNNFTNSTPPENDDHSARWKDKMITKRTRLRYRYPFNPGMMSHAGGTYSTFVGAYCSDNPQPGVRDIQTFMFDYGAASYNGQRSAANMWCPSIYMEPDPPYPGNEYVSPADKYGTKAARISLAFDFCWYTNWRCVGQLSA